MAQDAMTWTALLSLAAGIVGFALGYWSRPRDGVGQREADFSWPGKSMRVVDLEPSEFSHGWRGEA